ncbi:hypothetical protein N7509_010492 [Penicillium cosmopolitanum]|uniref:ABM domain-containing protein n=1 Tax=Penicillium cosmopolitanum TaxID=1131564 RepID=A0A9X0B4P2_9EURO|nr:uncharacterized protein N7509_010492 [Penicillium cosmopolitanum]KAJ5387951.1 hypothetical protein N7509_010492 [Penicillium cosmopolitanum]
MAVTELALLRLRSDSSSTTNEALTQVQAAQAAYSGYPVTFLQQIEDPSLLYLLGGWESVAKHNEWIASETNQKFLEQLKDDVEVEWMFHYNVNIFRRAEQKDGVRSSSCPKCTRVRETHETFSCGRGWKVDKRVDEDEEFILFSGWNTVEDHFGFAKTESFKEFGKIRELLTGSEVKHMKVEKMK